MLNKFKTFIKFLILRGFNAIQKNFYKKKGFRKLIKNKKLYIVRKIKSQMLDVDFKNQFNLKNEKDNEDYSLSLRQYLNDFLIFQNSRFFHSIFYYFGRNKNSFIYPIPKQWAKTLQNNNIKVNIFFCSALWILYSSFQYTKGLFLFFKIITLSLFQKLYFLVSKKFRNQISMIGKDYSIFCGDSFQDLGYKLNDVTGLEKVTNITNFPEWFKNKNNTNYLILVSEKNNKNFFYKDKAFTRNFYHQYLHDLELIKFIFNFLKIQKNIFKNFFSLKWGFVILHSELIVSQIIKSVKNNPKNIFFYWYANSYKPLWVKEFEKKNTEVFIYFKSSINSISEDKKSYLFNETDKDYDYLGLKLYSWKNYLSWNGSLKKILNSKIDRINKFELVNLTPYEPYFHNVSSDKKILIPQNSVCVFTNHLPKSHLGISRFNEYFGSTHNLLHKFLNDIYDVLIEHDLNMVLKMKKKKENDEYKRDLKIFDYFQKKSNVIFINSELPAFKILENCSGSISLPFSSTALISKQQNKISAYYDPINFISKDDIFRQNIELISSKKELFEFVKKMKQNQRFIKQN